MKKKIRIVIFTLLMIIMAGSIWNICQEETVHKETSNHKLKGSGENVGLIEEVGEIAQTFEESRDFCGISFLAGNYDRKTFGTIHLKLYDEESGELILKKDYDAGVIKNNKMNYFLFDEAVEVNEPHRYKIVISADMKVFFSHFTIWKTKGDRYKEGALFVNDKEQPEDLVFDAVYSYKEIDTLGLKMHRCSLVILLFAFLGLHCFLDIKKMYQWIFEKRVWIAIAVFVFMVMNKYNFSSMAEYDAHIESNEGTQYAQTVFGSSRPIRSDEWMVSLTRYLSAEYSDYGQYNEIVRAEKTTNLSASGLYRSYSALAQPSFWGYYLFGSEIGVSFMWCFQMVFGFLFAFEFCLILTKRKPGIALLGGILLWFSSYNMWWSTVNWMLSGQAALVCFYYCLGEKKRWRQVFFGISTAVFAANFAVNLYPAWQVPVGFIFLGVLIWMIVQNLERIKEYNWKDWTVLGLCVLFMFSIAGAFFWNYREYMTDIMKTAYPGKRVSYGGFKLDRMLDYLASFFTPFKNFKNPSEIGCFVTLFPLPYLLGIRVLWKKWKKGEKDLFLGYLMLVATVLMLYCTVELPKFLAKILLLTYSTPYRAVNILSYVMMLILIIILGRERELAKMKPVPAALLTGGILALAVWYSQAAYEKPLDLWHYVLAGILLFVIFVPLIADMDERFHKTAAAALGMAVLITSLAVNPLMCGLDAIYSRPVAKAVQEIVSEDQDGKWIAIDGGTAANFLIACGAPTINSVNYIPNMKMWKKLDPEGTQEEIYNRYAHIHVKLVDEETSMELKQEDVIRLKLDIDDLEKIGVKYLYTEVRLKDHENVHFEKLYDSGKAYIYRAVYQ